MKTKLILLLTSIIMLSCGKAHDVRGKMEQIREVGDTNVVLAWQMLDSLSRLVRDADEYTQAKYDLLSIRLHDKADDVATSDLAIREVLNYMMKKGTRVDRQEALYYAGSVYRDLRDTPRSMRYFQQSVETAEGHACDSLLLRNAYSQLYWQYFNALNYTEALNMARCELEVSKQLARPLHRPRIHVANCLLRLDSTEAAISCMDTTLDGIKQDHVEETCVDILQDLLYGYAVAGGRDKAKTCHQMLMKLQESGYTMDNLTMAGYHSYMEETDSAIARYKMVLAEGNQQRAYDAAKNLIELYTKERLTEKAGQYAHYFVLLCDSLDMGTRQEQAAMVKHEYQYHRDVETERAMRDENVLYRIIAMGVCSIAAITILSLLALIMYKRNVRLKKILELEGRMKDLASRNEALMADINRRENDLERSRRELDARSKELENINMALKENDKTIKEKSQLLEERLEQNKQLVRLLHQTELESNADDVVRAVKQGANGKHKLTETDWKQLVAAVDELYPTFNDMLVQRLGKFTEQQLRVCYLMRIGLTNSQIQNVMGLPKVTVWRWAKKFGEDLGDALYAK